MLFLIKRWCVKWIRLKPICTIGCELFACLFVCLSVYLSVCLKTYSLLKMVIFHCYVCLFVCLSVCLFVCLFVLFQVPLNKVVSLHYTSRHVVSYLSVDCQALELQHPGRIIHTNLDLFSWVIFYVVPLSPFFATIWENMFYIIFQATCCLFVTHALINLR